MTNISSIQLMQTYDQVEMETSFDGVLTGPTQYKDDIYYVEVKWDGYPVANSNKKFQFLIGSWSDSWNTDDDWSLQGLKKVDDNLYDGEMSKSENICVYSNGVLIGGTEPDGTTPGQTGIKGDVNGDKIVNSPDIVMLNKYLSNSITKVTNSDAADINGDGAVNIFDAVLLRRMLLS